MIPSAIKSEILQRIAKAEQQHDVRVIYAIESGSRACGFASPNSDFDVRFIYARPKDWYVAVDLEDKRDVIEYDIVDDIDINGWDIRKALKLLRKSNPSIVEWLHSPIVYVDDGHFADSARALIENIYAPAKGIYHYRSMAKTNYRSYLRQSIVPLKKYFYVLRPLLSVQWLEKFNKPAPIEFDKLTRLIASNSLLDKEISKLLQRKKMSQEKALLPAIPVINDFIEAELERLEGFNLKPVSNDGDIAQLNALFLSVLDE